MKIITFNSTLSKLVKNTRPSILSKVYGTASHHYPIMTKKIDCNLLVSRQFKTSAAVSGDFSNEKNYFSAAKAVEAMPKSTLPFLKLARYDRPIGSWLLFWPCGWSIAMAAPPGQLPHLGILSTFAAGAILMRGAGCTINDMWDADLDKKVDRTKDRPITSGKLTQFEALVFLGVQLSLSTLLLLQFNWRTVLLGSSSMILVVTYPLMKRVTYWPQFMLGLTFNWGALLGWSAVHGTCNWAVCLPLYLAGVSWTLVYDTIYAHQDKYDDIAVGIKSTALRFGDQTKLWISGFTSSMIANLLLAGHLCDQTWPYYTSVALIAGYLAGQIRTLNINDPDDCGGRFRSNRKVGLILFLGIAIGTLSKEKDIIKDQVSRAVRSQLT